MDNDALDSMDQLERAVAAILEGLRGLAPTTIENGGSGGYPRGRSRILGPHDANQDVDCTPCMAARQRTNFGNRFFWHLTLVCFDGLTRSRAVMLVRDAGGQH